jgi:hypothetical protein
MTGSDLDQFEGLIERLRARIANPARRRDARPSAFMAGIQTLDFGALLGQLGQASADFARIDDDNRNGRINPTLHAKADQIGRDMTTPVDSPLAPPRTVCDQTTRTRPGG